MSGSQKIMPCLWFNTEAEEAMKFYVGVFPDSRVLKVTHHDGRVLAVEFELNGLRLQALNGGPQYKINEGISLSISCEDQAEVDHYWNGLGEGGKELYCGWLTDRFGVTWQVVPRVLPELLASEDKAKSGRVMQAMMQMIKLDVAQLERAARGE